MFHSRFKRITVNCYDFRVDLTGLKGKFPWFLNVYFVSFDSILCANNNIGAAKTLLGINR